MLSSYPDLISLEGLYEDRLLPTAEVQNCLADLALVPYANAYVLTAPLPKRD